ncbi:MAG: ribonuclease HI [Spirochaetia bacterium]
MAIEIHTDGGCIGNPGPGAWAYVLRHCLDTGEFEEITDSGFSEATTNNRMELTAVIEALKKAQEIIMSEDKLGETVVLHTDSIYVKKGITEWIHRWETNGWKTAGKKPVKNKNLWQELKILDNALSVSWRWVRGHAGNPLNEACDRAVRDTINRSLL